MTGLIYLCLLILQKVLTTSVAYFQSTFLFISFVEGLLGGALGCVVALIFASNDQLNDLQFGTRW